MKKLLFVVLVLLLVGCKKNSPEAVVSGFLQLAAAGDVTRAMNLIVVEDPLVRDDIIELIATRRTYELIEMIAIMDTSSSLGSVPGMASVNLKLDFCTTKVDGKFKLCVYEDNTPEAVVRKFLSIIGRGEVQMAAEMIEFPDLETKDEIVAMIEAKDTINLIRSIAKYGITSQKSRDSENFSTITNLDFCIVVVDDRYKICVNSDAWERRPNKKITAP